MILADENGRVEGNFQVPSGVPSGTYPVEFVGKVASRTASRYTGTGQITIREFQRVVFVNPRRSDPLAQTFTLAEPRLLAGIDLWFTQKGPSDVRLQIRETQLGLPNEVILGEAILSTDEILIDGSPTPFRFSPLFAEAGVEYAIVILTEDPLHEVRIAEVGEWDPTRGFVTGQPYQVGVLLSSSNAVTWTPHQKRDLTFKLFAAKFTHNEKEVDFGTFAVERASDFIPICAVQRTSGDTHVRFEVTEKNHDGETGQVLTVLDNQALNMDHYHSGEISVKARLSGSSHFSPILFPGPQLATGEQQEEGDYVSRAIPCGIGSKLTITFEAWLPGTSSVSVFYEKENGFVEMSQPKQEKLWGNWYEFQYQKEEMQEDFTRVKLLLRGTAKDRPKVKRLRVITT